MHVRELWGGGLCLLLSYGKAVKTKTLLEVRYFINILVERSADCDQASESSEKLCEHVLSEYKPRDQTTLALIVSR